MAREWHKLKGNARSETAHNLIFFDTETKPEVLDDGSERDHLWFGWMCILQRTGKGAFGPPRWRRFSTVAQFWTHIAKATRGKSRWFLFCHNTSYDLPVIDIFGASVRRGWKIEGAVIEAPPTIITLKRDSVTLVFLDTLNWWRMPLAKLGERLGLPKLDMPPRDAGKAVWDVYCKRDVEVMKVTVVQWLAFLKDNDLGGFASTLASQCFRTFRHRFMTHEIVIDAEDHTHKISRESYHGGRVECFAFGGQQGPITHVDINSMYGAVMQKGLYPIRLNSFHEELPRERWPRLLRKYCIVARCVVEAKAPCYPVMQDKRLCFPLGRIETTLCTPEIELAIERGELLEMRDLVLYEKAPIFTAYIDYMWGERQKAQAGEREVDAWLFKHLLTNLYGKFGQTGLVFQTSDTITDKTARKFTIIDYDTGKVLKCRQMGGLLQVMSSEGESRDSFPAIAAHVTSGARVLLWRYIERAGLKNVLYTDTDSLFLTAQGARRVRGEIDPTALGKLKREGVYDHMHIHGLKDYELPHKTVRKGVRANAVQIAPNTFTQLQWSSLKGLVELGDVTAPRRRTVTKILKRKYLKGRKNPA